MASSLSELISSYSFKVGDKSYSSSITSSDGEYTASVRGIGTVTASSESAVEQAISQRVSEMA